MSRLTTTAHFECPACSRPASATVDIPEVDWCVEPLSDSLSQDESEMECDQCDTHFSVRVQNSPAGCHIEICDYPNVEVSTEEAPFSADQDDYDWLNDYEPLCPFDVYENNRHHLGDLLAEYGVGSSGVLRWSASIINRMIFAETISSLEAYLGDTLVRAVQVDVDAMQRLVVHDEVLSAEKVSLHDVLAQPQLVKNKVETYLRGLLYHNLAKVSKIYKIALGIDIFPDNDLKASLYKAIQLRHHVVHRNGRDKEGVEQEFPTDHVKKIMQDVQTLVRHIERSVISLRAKIIARAEG